MLPVTFLQKNRTRLGEKMAPRSLAVVHSNDVPPTNADGSAVFHQNTDLYYLTGVRQEETILLLCPESANPAWREVLFLRETTPLLETWEGKKLSQEAARKLTGIETVLWTDAFPQIFRQLMCEMDNLYLNSNEHKRARLVVESRDMRFLRETMRAYPLHNYKRLAPLLHALRVVKAPEEIDLMRKACALTNRAFQRVLHFVRPGVNEAEIEAEFAHEFIRAREKFAYLPIVASGKNALGLHYIENNVECQSGDLILLDVGGTCGMHNADMSRTIPVSGHFTPRQRTVYDAVLRAMRELAAQLRPGLLWSEWQKNSVSVLEREMIGLGLFSLRDVKKQDKDAPLWRRYFMHGIGHPLGLDVHDVGDVTQPMQAGWVLTCEPGLYIPEEEMGIRLENNFLVTENGPVDLMADIPIEAEEIEALMQQGKKSLRRLAPRVLK